MTRTFANTTALLTVVAAALLGGCQKTMGTAANGPFAPAGTLSPATSQPLIPFGPLNGATRVPPPPTGSTQASNSYASPSAMSAAPPMANPAAYDSFASSSGQPTAGASAFNNPNAALPSTSLSANARSNLGGMPVIDLTAGMNTQQNMPVQYQYGSQPVGSGIAGNPAPNNFVPNISVPPNDLASRLRPLDPNLSAAAIPMPGQSGFAPQGANNFAQQSAVQPTYGQVQAGGYMPAQVQPSVAMTQYRNDANMPSPAWESVQPASAASTPQNPQYVSQLPTGPSTEPVINKSADAAGQPQANSLLWRNPAVAR